MLLAEGFALISIGNADSYDYIKTEVQMKNDVPVAVYEAIERSLNSDFDVTSSSVLDSDSEYDMLIIVGARK